MSKFFTFTLIVVVMCMFVACGGGGEKADDKPAKTEAEMTSGGSEGYEIVDVTNGGAITGKVTFGGVVPQKKKLEITKDTNVCGKTAHYDESVVVSGDKGLANVVVKLTNIAEGKAYGEGPYQLDQKGCVFIPHVTLVPAGTPLTILNSDGVLHNIHTYCELNKAVNIAQPGFKKRMKQTFEKAEIIRVACDVHNWMGGYIVVTDHPYYAVTDANGNFEISGVPAGTYTVEYWQETLGKQTAEVSVTEGGSTDASAEYSAGS